MLVETFLPTPQDWDDVRVRMEVLVQRILVENIPALSSVKHRVEAHIKHQFSEEMTKKSTVINIGAIDANPASTAGVIEVMEKLHEYVPSVNGKLHKIICNGDQLSVERMMHAKPSRVWGCREADRLEGLIETAQEFHKEGIMLDVRM